MQGTATTQPSALDSNPPQDNPNGDLPWLVGKKTRINPYTQRREVVEDAPAVKQDNSWIKRMQDEQAQADNFKELGVDPKHPEKQGKKEDSSYDTLKGYPRLNPQSSDFKEQYDKVAPGHVYQLVKHENGVDVPTGIFMRKLAGGGPESDKPLNSRTSMGNILGAIGNQLASAGDSLEANYDKYIAGDNKAAMADAQAAQDRRHAGEYQSTLGSFLGSAAPVAATLPAAVVAAPETFGGSLAAEAALAGATMGADEANRTSAEDIARNKSGKDTLRDVAVNGGISAATGAILPGVGGRAIGSLFPSRRIMAKEFGELGKDEALTALGEKVAASGEGGLEALKNQVGHEASLRGSAAGYNDEEIGKLNQSLYRSRLTEIGQRAFDGMDEDARKAFAKSEIDPAVRASMQEAPNNTGRLTNMAGDAGLFAGASAAGDEIKHLNDPEENPAPTFQSAILNGLMGGGMGAFASMKHPIEDAAALHNQKILDRTGTVAEPPPMPERDASAPNNDAMPGEAPNRSGYFLPPPEDAPANGNGAPPWMRDGLDSTLAKQASSEDFGAAVSPEGASPARDNEQPTQDDTPPWLKKSPQQEYEDNLVKRYADEGAVKGDYHGDSYMPLLTQEGKSPSDPSNMTVQQLDDAHVRAAAHEDDAAAALQHMADMPSHFTYEDGTFRADPKIPQTTKFNGMTREEIAHEKDMASQDRRDYTNTLLEKTRTIGPPPRTRDAEIQSRLANAPIGQDLVQRYAEARKNVDVIRHILSHWGKDTWADVGGRFQSRDVFGDDALEHGSLAARLQGKNKNEMVDELAQAERELEQVRQGLKARMYAYRGPDPKAPADKVPRPSRGPSEPMSLIPFIRKEGGIRIGEKGEGKNKEGRDLIGQDALTRNIGLLRKKGVPADEMLKRVREAGYLPPAPGDRPDEMDINTLLEAIQDEMGGNKRYSEHDRQALQDWENHNAAVEHADRIERMRDNTDAQLDDIAAEHGIRLTDEDRDAVHHELMSDSMARDNMADEDRFKPDFIEHALEKVLSAKSADIWEGRRNLAGEPIETDPDKLDARYEARRRSDDLARSLLDRSGKGEATVGQLRNVVSDELVSPGLRKEAMQTLVDRSASGIVQRADRTGATLKMVEKMTTDELAELMRPDVNAPGFGILQHSPDDLIAGEALKRLYNKNKAGFRKVLKEPMRVVSCGG